MGKYDNPVNHTISHPLEISSPIPSINTPSVRSCTYTSHFQPMTLNLPLAPPSESHTYKYHPITPTTSISFLSPIPHTSSSYPPTPINTEFSLESEIHESFDC